MVVSSLGFLFASCIPVLELKNLAPRNASEYGAGERGELQQKPALSSKKPIKGKPRKAENFLIITVLFLSNTTGKNMASLPQC